MFIFLQTKFLNFEPISFFTVSLAINERQHLSSSPYHSK